MRRNVLALIVPLVCYSLIVLPYLDFVQVWDGRLYLQCLFDAVRGDFSLDRFACYGHPSLAFIGLYALPQYLSEGNIYLLNGVSFLLGGLAILAFAGIVRVLFLKAGAFERMLMTLVFACHPVVIGNTLHFNPDTGILFFSLYLLYFLLREKKIFAIVCGLLLVLTKEIGVLFYLIIVGLHILVTFFQREQTTSGKILWLKSRWPLLLPLPVFPLFALLQYLRGHQLLTWGVVMYSIRPHRGFLHANTTLSDAFLVLQDIFVLNFLWVPTLLIVLASLIFLYRWFFRIPDASRFRGNDRAGFLLILSIFLLSFLILFTYLPTHNIRYFLILYPFATLLFFYALQYLRMAKSLERLLLSAVIFLNVVSVFRTLDPVSRFLYGTFRIGTHEMLALASVHNECCGYGRDQLVYSLEFVRLSDLQDAFFERIRPDALTAIATDPDVWAGFKSDAVDPVTFRRTATGGILPRYINPFALPENPPKHLIFVEYPNVDHQQALDELLRTYEIDVREEVSIDGYVLWFVRMHRR